MGKGGRGFPVLGQRWCCGLAPQHPSPPSSDGCAWASSSQISPSLRLSFRFLRPFSLPLPILLHSDCSSPLDYYYSPVSALIPPASHLPSHKAPISQKRKKKKTIIKKNAVKWNFVVSSLFISIFDDAMFFFFFSFVIIFFYRPQYLTAMFGW